jgi:hypothetical protein
MSAAKGSYFTSVLFLIAGVAFLVYSDAATAQVNTPYTKDDCVKCHAKPVNDIASAGGKHKNVPCVGCHLGHPPEVEKPIALCNRCHKETRRDHFELQNCLGCHSNPHTPLTISFDDRGCLNCHILQTEKLREGKSRHSSLECSSCHSVHRMIPECSQCHTPHSEKVVAGCEKCHDAHMPKAVTYAPDIPSKDCGSCHQKAAELLSAGNSKHKSFECAFCHQEKHRMIPACQDCHGSPHPAGIMKKFSACGDCHNIAHDLL